MNESQTARPARHSRTARVIGWNAVEKLHAARVAVFGVGGVGGHLCEALARAGIGSLDLFDGDVVSPSNLNRQAVALTSTVGKLKVQAMRDLIADISPDCAVKVHPVFYLPENADDFDLSVYDYVADAIDNVAAKVTLVCRCQAAGIPMISAMGAGNKLYPDRFRVTDLAKTTTDPLARIMRRELGQRGIRHLQVVCSDEPPLPVRDPGDEGRAIPGSLPYVPGVAGMIMAGQIIRDLAGIC